MDPVVWEREPQLRRPLLVLAFEGWNDAGDASSTALSCLAEAWGADRLAVLDGQEYYDFTVTRPTVTIGEDARRSIEWPEVEILGAHVPGSAHDLVLVRGTEPQLRWKAFAAAVVDVARRVGAELAVTLGALLADVAHSRPVRVSGSTDDPELAERLNLAQSTYEGPTGIVGVLHEALGRADVPTASFWAAVPHYVHQMPAPKAALALVERVAALLGTPVDAPELRLEAAGYEQQVDDRIADDDDTLAYVAQLEDAQDGELALGDIEGLADEVEQFLRDHPRGER